jgi:hypothetical protein
MVHTPMPPMPDWPLTPITSRQSHRRKGIAMELLVISSALWCQTCRTIGTW